MPHLHTQHQLLHRIVQTYFHTLADILLLRIQHSAISIVTSWLYSILIWAASILKQAHIYIGAAHKNGVILLSTQLITISLFEEKSNMRLVLYIGRGSEQKEHKLMD